MFFFKSPQKSELNLAKLKRNLLRNIGLHYLKKRQSYKDLDFCSNLWENYNAFNTYDADYSIEIKLYFHYYAVAVALSFLFLFFLDYLCEMSITINVAADEGNAQNEI